ncbi:MAG: FkbM family methyltransferase, partial [Pseudomonadota bacterium]
MSDQRPGGYLHAQNAYGRYAIPEVVRTRDAARLLLAGRVYEPVTLRFMREHVGEGDIVHAGAFFGDFLPGLASALTPGARLWSFEPNPVSFAAAEETVRLNVLDNVTLRPAALSDRGGWQPLRTTDADGLPLGGASRIVAEAGPGDARVATLTLDAAIPAERPVSILQLDVEGHAEAALLGARALIARCRPILILEGLNRPRWIAETFPGPGYTLHGKVNGNAVFAPR